MDEKKKLIERRHPRYAERVVHWDFVEATYEGGRSWFAQNIHRYVKEGDEEFSERVARAYRFNHTREVVDLVDKYLFKVPATRKDDAPESVKAFWKSCTRNGLDISAYARQISRMASIYGRPWVVVDAEAASPEVVTRADQKKLSKRGVGSRVYSYMVRPQQVLDMSYDDRGILNWILIHEVGRDDADPFSGSGDQIDRYRLWTRKEWILLRVQKTGRKISVVEEDRGEHNLGEVPVFPADNTISEELYVAPGLVDDVAYLDRAVANYLSNLDAIIQDQTFSQLAMPAQGLLPGEEGHAKLLELGTKRIFTYDGEANVPPMYLSPDVKQAELILSAIVRIITEIYHSVGLSGERTKDDNGGGVDNSSGVAKGYDFERTNSLLNSKAASMQRIEDRLVRLVQLWSDETPVENLVRYPENFDTRGLYDEFEIGARLTLLNAPDGVRRTQMEVLIDKLFPSIPEGDRKKLLDELKSWPPEDALPGLGAQGKPGASGSAGTPAAAGAKKTAKEMTAG